ncbi:hypothetical protein [Acinetobacter radioresistens]|uniref:hypothetical protein n=1 Tax=Acinetobacter radioresistens TaxID=40216 RepID=UPI002003AFC0|nr:hypothetical protein [Acinetobacter radioresistens]MCK4090637.1 hypothetical protein [Acinetobacter radioresistens]MCK4108939.1 hypothetical protein [Acinetobacter radioresistens]
MKQVFPGLNIGTEMVNMNEFSIGQALSLAKIDPTKNEQCLSAFLGFVLNDPVKPYSMYGQQRYYCLLQYLGAQIENDLSPSVNVNDYLIATDRPWIESVEIEGVSFRQLNGLELEALELISTDVSDWLIGAMALQVTYEGLPYIQPLTDRRNAAKIIKNRYELLTTFDQKKIDDLYKLFVKAEEKLACFLYLGYDKEGIVIYEAEGGNQSVPARFQCHSALFGLTKQLFSTLVERSTTPAT